MIILLFVYVLVCPACNGLLNSLSNHVRIRFHKYYASQSSSSSSGIISLTSDAEVTKQIITKGTGKSIEAGDILAVEFEAFVQGSSTPFSKGEQEKFTFKDGSTIKGWDIAVGSMKIGEKAKFVCSPKYGYGEKGVSPVIPPNAQVHLCFCILLHQLC